MSKSISEQYMDSIMNELSCEITESTFGKCYHINSNYGKGKLELFFIEKGLEVSRNLQMEVPSLETQIFNEMPDALEVGYMFEGEVTMIPYPRGNIFKVKEGDVFIYRMKNSAEKYYVNFKQSTNISITMDPKVIENVLKPQWIKKGTYDWENQLDHLFKGKYILVQKANVEFKRLAKRIVENSMEDLMDFITMKGYVFEFLAEAFRLRDSNLKVQKTNIEEKVKMVKDVLWREYANPPILDELAEYLGISKYKLQKAFKEVTGDTVYHYILNIRMKKAEEMLKNSEMSVLEIAHDVGYDNPSKFSKIFKRKYRCTPLKYRNSRI
ncbi:helix-turn-helix transcriptional regulator [Clostridium sp. D2Q-14]|uniref:helix-turn-helix domain-containing protein n=1 Tax=Anaeromonas gelatinilytica TaxID=2683194 RepID=UPI00193C1080|nr:response regulator transcription factor [Anaeromonas gelatinilytica]MBS4536295.1 helix-turn-helix transcriptional regulator [Anaeromonas gelatinilytica]